MRRGDPPVILTERTCYRCGVRFRALGRNLICLPCRRPPAREKRTVSKHLSHRERQIIGLVANGLANKEIAALLFLTVGTVKVYLSHIFEKAGVDNRTCLAIASVNGKFDLAPASEAQSPAPGQADDPQTSHP